MEANRNCISKEVKIKYKNNPLVYEGKIVGIGGINAINVVQPLASEIFIRLNDNEAEKNRGKKYGFMQIEAIS